MKDNVNKRNLETKTALVFLITFVLAAGLTDYQNQTQEKLLTPQNQRSPI